MNLSKTAKIWLIAFALAWLGAVCVITVEVLKVHRPQNVSLPTPTFVCGQEAGNVIARPNASEMRRLTLGANVNGNCATPGNTPLRTGGR